MDNSLRDQLLKAGLVDKKQVKTVKKNKYKKDKQQQKSRTGTVDENELQLRKRRAEKDVRDRELNRQREKEKERKAVDAQIKQLIETNRQTEWGGNVAYNFTDNKKIKRIFVSEVIQGHLSCGRLAIVKLGERYELVPAAVAKKIRIRDEGRVILCNEPRKSDDEDDPYADYQIPDNLMW